MRRKIIAGNWKMNLGPVAAAEFVGELLEAYARLYTRGPEMILAVPFVDLTVVREWLRNSTKIYLGAQNLHQEDSGAYTGEISAGMLRECGCEYVLVGHSERRQYFGEDNALLLKKVQQALKHGLTPIYCFGETLAEREGNRMQEVVRQQLVEGLFVLEAAQFSKVILAYEPVWAIGTGKVATPEEAQAAHVYARAQVKERYGAAIAEDVTILYGGSVKPDNAKDLLHSPDIDGALVGGASLKVGDFLAIANGLPH